MQVDNDEENEEAAIEDESLEVESDFDLDVYHAHESEQNDHGLRNEAFGLVHDSSHGLARTEARNVSQDSHSMASRHFINAFNERSAEIRRFWVTSPLCPILTLHLELLCTLKLLRDRFERRRLLGLQKRRRERKGHRQSGPEETLGVLDVLDVLDLADKVLADFSLETYSEIDHQDLTVKLIQVETSLPPHRLSHDSSDYQRTIMSQLLRMLGYIAEWSEQREERDNENVQGSILDFMETLDTPVKLQALGFPQRVVFCVFRAQLKSHPVLPERPSDDRQ